MPPMAGPASEPKSRYCPSNARRPSAPPPNPTVGPIPAFRVNFTAVGALELGADVTSASPGEGAKWSMVVRCSSPAWSNDRGVGGTRFALVVFACCSAEEEAATAVPSVTKTPRHAVRQADAMREGVALHRCFDRFSLTGRMPKTYISRVDFQTKSRNRARWCGGRMRISRVCAADGRRLSRVNCAHIAVKAREHPVSGWRNNTRLCHAAANRALRAGVNPPRVMSLRCLHAPACIRDHPHP